MPAPVSLGGDRRILSRLHRHLLSPDASVRGWAETALRQLRQTREGRKVLWGAHQQQEVFLALPAVHDEQFVREVLAHVLHDLHKGSRGEPHEADRDR